MTEMTDELLARIAARARDASRRYMTAAEGQSRVELPVEEIERRWEEWHAKNREKEREAALRDGMTPEEYDRNVQRNQESQSRIFGEGKHSGWSLIEQQMRAWGHAAPKTMSFIETEDHIGVSAEPPGAKPLRLPPDESDWAKLEQIAGRPIPDELKRLYSIADGGFGPGFTGLNSVQSIGINCEDFRRRGPDYCGTVAYPDSFLPIAEETLNYHYDLDSGRIISSNQDWGNDGLEPQDIYDIAFQSLAAMMEDWLSRS